MKLHITRNDLLELFDGNKSFQIVILLISIFWKTSVFSFPANWRHTIQGPLPLEDSLVYEVYKNEKTPERHHGITVTDYLKVLDHRIVNAKGDCYKIYIGDWIAQSTIYIRPESSLFNNSPRFQKIQDFACNRDDRFNTYSGTEIHEKHHVEVRDQKLQSFWLDFFGVISNKCFPSSKTAEKFLFETIEDFLKAVRAADQESSAEQVELEYYVKEYKKTTGKDCHL